jgi:hypothetical protein
MHDVELYKPGALMFSMLSGGNRTMRISPRLAAYYSPLAGIMQKNIEMILIEAETFTTCEG